MKKNLIVMAVVAISCSIMACGSLSKENKTTRNSIDGTWELTEVTYGGQGYFKSTMFNDVDAKCFKGSEWFFRSNNSTGYYDIKDSECNPGQRFIRWSVQDVNGVPSQFSFKFIDENKKDLYGGAGFVMNVVAMNPETMTLSTSVSVDGSPVDLIYDFKKVSSLD